MTALLLFTEEEPTDAEISSGKRTVKERNDRNVDMFKYAMNFFPTQLATKMAVS